MNDHRTERGYTLMEILVVVAIIGTLTMVTVPNFISFYRSNQLKSALRQFGTDVRSARAKAVTTSSIVRITFNEAKTPGTYSIEQSTDSGKNWTRLKQRGLTGKALFKNGNFVDVYGDKLPDIVFLRDGTANVPAGEGKLQILVKDNDKIFEVAVSSTGKVTTK
jgi:prepilin-type N-terminal cleavage/methylation domain-containing protein